MLAIRNLHPTIALVVRSNDIKSCAPEIATLQRPGGQTTGAIYFCPEATARRFNVLKQLIPGLRHVAVLYQPDSDWAAHWADVEAAARDAGLRLHRAAWKKREDLALVFDDAIAQQVEALLTLGDGPTWSYRHSIIEIAAARRLPVMYDFGIGRPQEFRLFVNHDAAKTLGLRVPQSLLLRADQVIE